MTSADYAHLGLRDWPFRIVPEPDFCDFLADRSRLRQELDALLDAMDSRPASDIQLIWSWYGAGKTHALYYLAGRCVRTHSQFFPVYVELPREARGFSDLYRATIARLPLDRLIDAHLEHVTRPTDKMSLARHIDPDLNNALTLTAVGDKRLQVLLNQWLLGNPLPAASLRELGVGGRISTADKCAEVLADVITLLVPRAGEGATGLKRILWTIDEVQRVGELTSGARQSVLSGIVGVFNKCPTGLTLLLSYSGEPEESELPKWIPRDLGDRIGLERPMLLPPLTFAEAVLFIRELLAHFRLPNSGQYTDFFPFEAAAIDELIKALSRGDSLKPRSIMETLDASLRHLEPQIRAGKLKAIHVNALREALNRFALKWEDSPKRPKR